MALRRPDNRYRTSILERLSSPCSSYACSVLINAPLTITPKTFRDKQARRARSACSVAPLRFPILVLPAFSLPATRRRDEPNFVTRPLGRVVSVYLLHQYGYSSGTTHVGAETGDVVIDAGACSGDTPLYFVSRVGPTGRVYTSSSILRASPYCERISHLLRNLQVTSK